MVYRAMAAAQWRVQEFVGGGGGGGENLKGFFFLQGRGPAQKLAEKVIFPTKKVAKYR